MRKQKEEITFNIYTDASMLNPLLHLKDRKIEKEKLKKMKVLLGYGIFIETSKEVSPEKRTPYVTNNPLANISGKFDLIADTCVAELYSILRSVQYVKELVDKQYIELEDIKKIRIFTDSKFASRLLNGKLNLDPNAQKNYTHFFQLNQQIVELRKELPFEISWVKSHVNIEGNEKADKLAKKGKYREKEQIMEALNILKVEHNNDESRKPIEKERKRMLVVNPNYSESFVANNKEVPLNIEKEELEKTMPKKYERFAMTGTLKKIKNL